MLLENRPSLVTSMTKAGNTCAHIAAKKGSTLVVEKLMKFDRMAVISSRNRINESTPLHIAAQGGHRYEKITFHPDSCFKGFLALKLPPIFTHSVGKDKRR